MIKCRTEFLFIGLASVLHPNRFQIDSNNSYQNLASLLVQDEKRVIVEQPMASLGDDLMDTMFNFPMDPESTRKVFKLENRLPEKINLGLYHDTVAEEFSMVNGHNLSLIFSWFRRVFGNGRLLVDTSVAPKELRQSIESRECQTAILTSSLSDRLVQLCLKQYRK